MTALDRAMGWPIVGRVARAIALRMFARKARAILEEFGDQGEIGGWRR